MAITSGTEDWRGVETDENIVGGSAIRFYQVVFDTNDPPAYRPIMARNSPEVPALLEAHPHEPYLFVQQCETWVLLANVDQIKRSR